jgi:hypothetical protein
VTLHATASGGFYIHDVHASAIARDHLELRQRLDGFGANFGVLVQDRIRVARLFDHVLVAFALESHELHACILDDRSLDVDVAVVIVRYDHLELARAGHLSRLRASRLK